MKNLTLNECDFVAGGAKEVVEVEIVDKRKSAEEKAKEEVDEAINDVKNKVKKGVISGADKLDAKVHEKLD